VNQYTKGRVKLDIKEGLIGPTESLLAISDGRVDMGGQLTALCSGTFPLLDFGAMPGFITTGPGVGYEWAAALLDPRMQKILEDYTRPKGFIILGASPALAANAIYGNKPIRTLDDFKGQKIRGGGVIMTKELEAFGAKAVSISTAEVEQALIRGTVDAVHTTLNFGQEHRFFEIVKYINIWPFSQPYAMLISINAKKFDALPKDLQNGLRAAGRQITWEIASVCEQQEKTYTIWAEASKAKVIYAEPGEVKKAADRMVPVIKFWLKIAGPQAPEVLRIAAEYATGPAVSQVKELVK
jgi:TRAP-type C4-dicarboxylate transport system substrate-binding protein